MTVRRFDVVIVGAGAAGCVLAARLSEDPERSVLLVEAGPDLTWDDAPTEMLGPSFNLARSLPGRSFADLLARRVAGQSPSLYHRGHGIGGSSAINAMVALPGHADDYDEWEREYGCAGWSWRDVQPWFERVLVAARPAAQHEHGHVNRALLAACPTARPVALTRDVEGRRTSVVDSYLDGARARPNLTVVAGCPVDTVLLDGRTACGVRLDDGIEIEAALVVMAAGAIHSPTLLLRSGIDRPGLGRGLQDHAAFPIPLMRTIDADPAALQISALARLAHHDPEDLQLLPMETADHSLPGLGLLLVAAMRVHSRGAITLSPDGSTPVIEFDMLSDERDVDLLAGGVRLAEQVLDHPAFAEICVVGPYDASESGLRAGLGDYVHAVGTCRMGGVTDEAAVVDHGCAVIGYDGLVVCDASVMPAVPRANTHLPTLMIAERIAAQLSTR